MTNMLSGLILIVDDTPTNLDVVCEALSDAGLEVAIATSGERALQQVQRELPDLILLDVMMPGIDGFETCQRLKADPLTRSVPIIFMTALSDTDSKIRALDLGAADYITKPFQEQEVLARVKTHLQIRSLTKELEQDLDQKNAALQASQLHLIQSEKMSALGNLVAGIAHEINNPIGFLRGSIEHIQDYLEDLMEHLDCYQQTYSEASAQILDHAEDIELDLIREDLPKILDSMKAASHRIAEISTSLRTFSRSDSDNEDAQVLADIHEGLDSTLLILKYRLKASDRRPEILVQKLYGNLPEVPCFPGQLNQVFMNLLANAIDAFDEATHQQSFMELATRQPTITIETLLAPDQQSVEIWIRDNAFGMSEAVQQRIFDWAFTTKGVGRGTGLGLAIARQIVVDRHQGELTVNSTLGEGSSFCLRLPLPSMFSDLTWDSGAMMGGVSPSSLVESHCF
ncbi:response regulator [Limnothrix sp. FACHB-708]|uniref:sensor histidine kinase n=1 Tax=Limnothrix sp. FACHB-708 TaxID=2692818 RepID=UPI0016868D08|nr:MULTISPECIES: response regulator [unclassified Limnothrix]MBD2552024.1 response regulator [Limnothrix sp. FACHB-708]MBD2589704.1 response regulator [Limnothrix sp. FACHB-406]